ncbi:MAG: hypothetical protein GDA51_13430 [Ekhidna sp.]|nr:hypothetical protein [Ekhidna sp.]
MKLFDVTLFVVAFSFFVMGIHQAMVVGISESYWIFMFSLMPLFLYGYRKGMSQEQQKKNAGSVRKRKRK